MYFANKGSGTLGSLWMQGVPVFETFMQDERREGNSNELCAICAPQWCNMATLNLLLLLHLVCLGNRRVCSILASKSLWGVFYKGVGIGCLGVSSGFPATLLPPGSFWEGSGCGNNILRCSEKVWVKRRF